MSYARADVAWAQRFYHDLAELGFDCFFDVGLRAGEAWSEALQEALDRSRALVVLWSVEGSESKGIRTELTQFDKLSDATSTSRHPIRSAAGSSSSSDGPTSYAGSRPNERATHRR